MPEKSDTRRLAAYLLYVTITGGAILALELLGSRVMAPYFGTTIVIWTALISITLIALATGYLIGGWFIDRYPKASSVHLPVVGAGLCVIFVQGARQSVLTWALGMGMHTGCIVGATILFLPPLLLLGMVSPMVIRLNLHSVKRAGRVAGSFYAVSTIGSVIGAVLTGFILVEHISTGRLLHGIAALLVALGVVGLVISRMNKTATTAAIALVLGITITASPPVDRSVVRHHARAAYGNHLVIDYRGVRFLTTDGLIHTTVKLTSGENVAPYIGCMELLPCIRPQAKTSLQIGLGGGLVPTIFRKHYGISSDVVEIDAAVVPLARDYFGFEAAGDLYIEDGRTFFSHSEKRYDLIVLDVFSTDRQPWHLFSREYFEIVKGHLTGDGVLALNLFGYDSGPDVRSWHSVVHTLQAVYPEVSAFYATLEPLVPGKAVNVVVFASAQPLTPIDIELARESTREFVQQCIDQQVDISNLQDPLLLTDDFNPLDRMTAPIFLDARRKVIKYVGQYLAVD
jgi:spermidine synthase